MCRWLSRVFNWKEPQTEPPIGRPFSTALLQGLRSCRVCGATENMKRDAECNVCHRIAQADDDELPDMQKAAQYHVYEKWLSWSEYLAHTWWKKQLAFIECRLMITILRDKNIISPNETPADVDNAIPG